MLEGLERMEFPNTLEEFIKEYSFVDEEELYTNGSELIPTLRVKQWNDHKKQQLERIKQHIKDKVRKSFEVDWGISDKRSDRLFGETIVELQLIESMIDDILDKERS